MRHGAARRQKKSGEQHYPNESRPYRPDPGSGRCKLQWGWRHRVPRAMSLSTRGNPGARDMVGMRRFDGTDTYVATQDLRVAVNAAIALERPLLVKGEPGTGKTILAHEIARGIGKDLMTWHIKSTTKAQQGLYEYDAVSRLGDGKPGDDR